MDGSRDWGLLTMSLIFLHGAWQERKDIALQAAAAREARAADAKRQERESESRRQAADAAEVIFKGGVD